MIKCSLFLLLTILSYNCFSQDLDKKAKKAIALAEKGELDESFRIFIEIKKEYKRRGEIEGTAGVLNNIGRIYYMMNNFPEARRNFQRSYHIYQSIGDKSSQAQLIMNIGATYETDTPKELDKALKYYQKGYQMYRKLNDSIGINRSLLNMGTIFGRQNESRKALNVYLKALPFLERNGTENDQVAIYTNIGTSFYELNETDSSLPYLYKAKSMRGNLEYDIYINRTLAKAYAKLNKPDSVNHYIDLFSQVKDKLQDEQTMRSITEISQKYKSQVKEEEIEKLKLGKKRDRLWLTLIVLALVGMVMILGLLFRNRMIRSDQQKTELEHRILRAQMNPHFLFNCLSSIQRMYIEGDIQRANDLTADFGTLLRQILDHTSQSRIRLKEELDTLQSYMQIEQIRLGEKFLFEIIVDENLDINNILVPPLISQPIVENAIWHGIVPLESNGKITVRCNLSSDEKLLILDITDNGVGFFLEESPRKGSSKGIELVEKRLTPKGFLQINKRKEGGTRVTINLPVEYED